MIKIRKAYERGHAHHGWLDTYHTFSFNTYYDEKHMGFRALRVINDDIVAPGKGFGTHPHQNMEIITYVLDGALEHKDSMGNGSVIKPGDVQRMSAGTGVMHSEFNHSKEEKVHLLQIWILPKENGLKPGYEQKHFTHDDKSGKLLLIASEDGHNNSVKINQDAKIYATVLESEKSLNLSLEKNRYLWIHIAQGEAKLNDIILKAGDGASVGDESEIILTGIKTAEVLVFDLA